MRMHAAACVRQLRDHLIDAFCADEQQAGWLQEGCPEHALVEGHMLNALIELDGGLIWQQPYAPCGNVRTSPDAHRPSLLPWR